MFLQKKYIILTVIVSLLTLSPFYGKSEDKKLQLMHLRCELLTNPLGIDAKHPRLSWELSGEERGVQQKAYQIIVSSSKEKLAKGEGDIWNSGKVTSNQSVNVIYDGKELKRGMSCYWKVRLWTNKGKSKWSQPAHWSMGLLEKSDWKAEWIGLDSAFSWDHAESKFSRLSARYFRKGFSSSKKVKRAIVYITGLGYYQLYINGKRIGKQVLTPSPTDYTKSVLYNTYDVTDALKRGKNVVGTILGNGLFFTMRQNYKTYKIRNFGYPKMRFQLEILYEDGSKKRIVSNPSWKVTADGPIRTNNIYDGEEYDARKEMKGWSTASFDDNEWLKAEMVSPPGGELRAQMNEKVKRMDTLQPVSIHYLRPGVYIMDMGQNMAGWLRMKVNGSKGRKVTLRFSETLLSNGELATANLRDAKVTDVYTLSGEGMETWEPSFIYHGFRYVEITNYPGVPTVNDFSGIVVYDGLKQTGQFTTSNSLVNKIYHNAYWSISNNYKGLPVDCPQRNERMPWLGDRAMSCYGESFIFGNAKIYAQCLNNIQQSQTKEGVIPDVAPAFWKYYTDDITWPATYFMAAKMLYHQYGDLRSIKHHYASMKKWVGHIREKYMEDYLIPKDKYGDWCMPPGHIRLIHAIDSSRITDGTLLATVYYYHILTLMEDFAQLLNKSSDKKEFASLVGNIKQAFNNKFLDEKTGVYSNNTVTANVLPLYWGMTPDQLTDKVFENLTHEIETTYDGHISTGTLGSQVLLRVLTKFGRPDLAYNIVNTKEYPGWGYMVDNGATTVWELWNGNKSIQWMSSRDHVMLLGDLVIWFYENMAGIKSDENIPGFKRTIMKPSLVDSLSYVKASYHSIYGEIKSSWKRNNKHFTWDITVPGNTTAKVYIPARAKSDITENGNNISSTSGMKFLRMEGKYAVFKIGSGKYSFDSKL